MTLVDYDGGPAGQVGSSAKSGVRFTIVAPARNEPDNLAGVVREIDAVLAG